MAEIARYIITGTIFIYMARVFLRFPKISQHSACIDHAILHEKPFSNPLFLVAGITTLNTHKVHLLWSATSTA